MQLAQAIAPSLSLYESPLSSYYREGWDAFFDKTTQPYDNPMSAAGQAWEDGWMAAYRNDRECRAAGAY